MKLHLKEILSYLKYILYKNYLTKVIYKLRQIIRKRI